MKCQRPSSNTNNAHLIEIRSSALPSSPPDKRRLMRRTTAIQLRIGPVVVGRRDNRTSRSTRTRRNRRCRRPTRRKRTGTARVERRRSRTYCADSRRAFLSPTSPFELAFRCDSCMTSTSSSRRTYTIRHTCDARPVDSSSR